MAVYADQELQANFCSWDYDGAGEEGSRGVVLSVAEVNLHMFPKTLLREIHVPWCYQLVLQLIRAP